MAADDKETEESPPKEETTEEPADASAEEPGNGGESPAEQPKAAGDSASKKPQSAKLPPSVEKALAKARAAVEADRQRKSGRWLALIPASIGVIFLLLLMPRGVAPDAIPLPRTDMRVVSRIARQDDERAAKAEEVRLAGDVLALGTALRSFNAVEAQHLPEADYIRAQQGVEGALRGLQKRPTMDEELLTLRALQTKKFIDAVAQWERTGEMTTELIELGGAFIERTINAGWTEGRRILMDEAQRRVAFKSVWNAIVGVDMRPAFALALDEQRALYTFYLQHPHPSDSWRGTVEAELRAATDPQACQRANATRQRFAEQWRLEKIRRLGAIDPAYPARYALGVSLYKAGRFEQSADAFASYISAHPDGAYTLRARNHLKAALQAQGAL